MLDASPLKNSFIGRIIHDRYQNHLQKPDGTLTLASILNETLSKLKGRKPNKQFLKPLNVENPSKERAQEEEENSFNRYSNNQWLHDSFAGDTNNMGVESAEKSRQGSQMNVLNIMNDGYTKQAISGWGVEEEANDHVD